MIQSVFSPILAFISSLVNIGTDPDDRSLDGFHVKLINVVAIASIVVLVLAFPLVGFHRRFIIYVPIFLMLFVAFGGLYLNSTKRFDMAKITLVVFIPVIQFLNLIFVDVSSIGIESTFLPLAMLVAVVFRNKWWKFILVFILLSFFVIVFNSRGYDIDSGYLYSPIIHFAGVLVGVMVAVEYLQQSAIVLKNRNDQLTTQNQNLEELVVQNEHKTELLGILSHDLKGPAAAFNQISKKVSFLLKKERYEELVEFGNYFEAAGDKIYHDIDRLLNWTIAQKSDIVIRIEDLSPHRLINRITDGLVYHVSEKGIGFNNTIPSTINFNTDIHLLEIILKNLLFNAANHSVNKTEVDIEYSETPTLHIISINNQGSAIDLNIVEQAKLGRYRKSKEGHGLGLGICFSLIRFLDGELEFESSKANGTTAIVKLPKEV